jgi:hypothetical protein
MILALHAGIAHRIGMRNRTHDTLQARGDQGDGRQADAGDDHRKGPQISRLEPGRRAANSWNPASTGARHPAEKPRRLSRVSGRIRISLSAFARERQPSR